MDKAFESKQGQADAMNSASATEDALMVSRTALPAVSESESDLPKQPEYTKELREQRIKQLSTLSLIEYEPIRKEEAKTLGMQVATLDTLVKAGRNKHTSALDSPFDTVEVWPMPVNLSSLLDEIAATVRRFIVCEPEVTGAVALWVVMTWIIDVIKTAPLAVITAPEKRCGKSQLLFLLGNLVRRPVETSNITTAAFFRMIDQLSPTLLIDEFDTFVRNSEDLRGAINAGHTPKGCIWRVVGDDYTPTPFKVFGAKALAGIGTLHGTIMDRSIILPLRRKLPHESVERLRHAEPGLFDRLASQLARVAEDFRDTIADARPDIPDELNDRAQDNWEPLLAIADAAGKEWGYRARRIAIKLSAEKEDSSRSIGVELLSDIQAIFIAKNAIKIPSSELVNELCKDEERPWASYNNGYPIKPVQIAKQLNEFGISSTTIRTGERTAKGYFKNRFDDAFARYLSHPGQEKMLPVTTSQLGKPMANSVTASTSVTAQEVTSNTGKTSAQSGREKSDVVTASSKDEDGTEVEETL